MITLAILQLLAWIAQGLMAIIPVVSVPSWLTINGPVGTVFQAAGSMGVWFPVQLVATILGGVVVIWAGGFAVKLTRMVISVFTGGGGSAA